MQLYNSRFEISLRVLLILSYYKQSFNDDLLTAIDLFNTYGKNYGYTEMNLHGDNELSFRELDSRKKIIKIALKYLLTKGFVVPGDLKMGFTYKITPKGTVFVNGMDNDYLKEYTTEMKIIHGKINNLPDNEIINHSHNYKIGD